MQTISTLARKLNEPPLPEPVSWLPQTQAWTVLFVILFCWLSYQAYKAIKAYRQNKYRREGLTQLSAIDIYTPKLAVRQLNWVLKNVAVAAFGVEKVGSLHGQPWLAVLTNTSDIDFNGELTNRWQQALFQPRLLTQFSEQEMRELKTLAVSWVKGHQGGDYA